MFFAGISCLKKGDSSTKDRWNDIMYRVFGQTLFSQISSNWEGTPLKTYETILNFIKTTKTKTGLKVDAVLDEKYYEKGKKVSKEVMDSLAIKHHETFPKWNYTIKPQ